METNRNSVIISSQTKPKQPERKRKSSTLRFADETQKQIQLQAGKHGLTQAAYITVLVTRNCEGADKSGFEKEVANAKKYMR